MKDRLKQIRISLNLSQIDMAKRIDVELNTYRGYEYKTKNLPDFILKKLAVVFNVNLNWLYTGQGEMFVSHSSNSLEKTNNTLLLKNLETFHKRFNQIQIKNGLSDFQMSVLLDIPESRIEKLGIGKTLPTTDELCKIKSKFDVSIDELLFGISCDKNDNDMLNSEEIKILKKLVKRLNLSDD